MKRNAVIHIEKGKISGKQYMFAVACFLQASLKTTAFLAGITFHESWVVAIAGTLLSLPLLFLFRAFMVRFPRSNLIEIFQDVFGPVIGKVLGAAYIWFFVTLTCSNLILLGEYSKITLLALTPRSVLILTCVLVAAWAVRNGISVVTRYGLLIVVAEILVTIFAIFLVWGQINLANFLPLFTLPAASYAQGLLFMVAVPYGELIMFSMIKPSADMSPKDTGRYWFTGVAIGAVTILISMIQTVGVLGNTFHLFALSGLASLQISEAIEPFSRMEMMFAIGMVLLLFFKIMLSYYASVLAAAQLFGLKSYKRLVLVIGGFLVVYCSLLSTDSIAFFHMLESTIPVIWTLFVVLIPVLTFLVARARKRPVAKEG